MQKHQELEALTLSTHPVDYIDVRIEKVLESSVVFKNGELLTAQEMISEGAFLRVYHQGRWHELSTTNVKGLQSELAGLVERARKSAPGKGPKLTKRPPGHHDFTPYSNNNCSQTPLTVKKEFCQKLLSLPKEFPEIGDWSVNYTDRYKEKWFKSSDGVSFMTDYNHAGVVLVYALTKGTQKFNDNARLFFMRPDGLEEKAKNHFRESVQESIKFLDAETVTPGKYEVLLSPEVTGVFTHESFGHKSEADFMLGDETMLKEWSMGKKVAAECVSIVDEGDTAESSGYCPIDDEGNRKQKVYLIKDGVLAGRLHNMTTAASLAETNTGNGRAINFEFSPIVRMTNTYIESGRENVAEVIKHVKKGIFIKTFRHGSGLSTFTIAPSKSYLIEDGKITKPLKVAVISGTVFESLMNITAVANDFYVKSSAFGGCGKGDQSPLPVADGGPSILVSGMQVS